MKYLYFLLSFMSVIGISLFFTPSYVSAQVACAKILNIQVQGTVEMGKEFQCLVTADQPTSPNIACGIRIGDLSQWPNNYCPSDTAFGGWNGNIATFNCTIPQRNDVTADTPAELAAYDFRDTAKGDPITCGPQTGKTLSIKINSSSGQNGSPVPSQGVSQSPGGATTQPTQQVSQNPQATPTTPITGDSDLNKCIGYDVYGLAERVRKASGSDELAEKVIARFREVCAGKTAGQTPTPSISGGVAVSMTPGQGGTNSSFPSSLSEFFNSTKVTTEAMRYINDATPCAQNMSMYISAASQGGLPTNLAAILAGIHYIEGSCNLSQSLRNGYKIGQVDTQGGLGCSSQDTGPGKPIPIGGGCGFATVLDSAIWATRHFVGKSGVPQRLESLVYSYGLYNGTGNNACSGNYVYYVSDKYTWCPEKFKGEAHPYGMNYMGALFPEYKNYVWYVLFCQDGKLCPKPLKPYTKPNAAMIALLAWRKFNNAL